MMLWSHIRDCIADCLWHSCVLIGWCEQWRYLATLGCDHGGRDHCW